MTAEPAATVRCAWCDKEDPFPGSLTPQAKALRDVAAMLLKEAERVDRDAFERHVKERND